MRKLIILLLCTVCASVSFAQNVDVSASAGTLTASYSTLKLAFDNINNGTHKGIITIAVNANTTETASAVLNASGVGSANYTTISIQPSGGGARIISGTLATPLIDLNGADNVTIDGLNTGGNSLTISNASTSNVANTSTIRFIQDATNNTINNCTIEGSQTNAASGTVYFSNGTAAVTTGNDGNSISNNIISAAGGNLPVNAIYSAGKSVAIDNSGISINNNNIQDYYNAASASNGIFIASNSSAWIITGNRFFQTANRTCTITGYIHHAINIVSASGSGYVINNNIIGFANATGTGFTVYDGTYANRFVGIEITASTAVASDIQGNAITGINLFTTSAVSTTIGIFSGISVLAGSVNIGTTSANTIGAASGTGAITIESTTTGGAISGVYAASVGTMAIQNNTIGALNMGGGTTVGYTFNGINTAGANGDFTISANTIGSTTTANSILVGNADGTTAAVSTFNGISNAATGITNITNNNVQNCSVFSSGASVFSGIKNSGSTGTLNINGNGIRTGTNTGTGTFTCISNTAAATTININSNILRSHLRTAGSGAFIGISNTGSAASAINIAANQIGNSNGGALTFTNPSTGTITGIINNAGAATTTVSINDNSLQGFSVVSSGTFTGISNAGATGVAININNNQLGNAIVGSLAFSATTGSINGIVNSGGTASTAVSIYSNSLLGFSGSAAGAFIGINNSVAGATVDITYNQLGSATRGILTLTNSTTGAITGIINSGGASSTTANINNNSLMGFSLLTTSAAFTGISNTGAAGTAININTNQLGNSSTSVLTIANASTGAITGISNSAGTSTTSVTVNNNSLQGFSVVSLGTFTGIINAGALIGGAINLTNNHLGAATGSLITYSAANAGAFVGISNTGGASTCALSVLSNDIRGIVYSVPGTASNTYIINSAATGSQNMSSNTFTNLDINVTGTITFISNNVIVSATGVQNVNSNSISGVFTRNSASAAGNLILFTSSANSVAGAVITNSSNNFSNITVSGAATISGWINTDGGDGTKSIQGNTFSNWTGGTGLITGLNVNISGAGNVVTGNNINTINGGGNITAITTGAGNDNIYSNTISTISSTGAGATVVTGIAVTAGTTKNIYQNTITGLHANFSNLSGNVQNSLSVNGVWISGGTTVNVNRNTIYGFTADAIDAGTINGVTVSGGATVTISRNKIYDLSSNSTAINSGGISGFFVYNVTGSVTNIINNIIGDIRTPFSGNSDSYRGISINTNTVSDINVYFNTIYLNSTSTGSNFGSTGIYHAFSSNPAVGKLDLRNNIITNLSVPNGSGITALFRQYGAPLDNYAATSNNNLYYAGPAGPKRVIFLIDPSSSDQALSTFKTRLGNREGQSFTEDVTVNFLSLVGSSPYFLHIDSTICTRLESGGINISGITDDYDRQVRAGNTGYTGTGSAPDIGADEFEGNAIPTAVLSGPTAICAGSSATLSLAVIGNGTIWGKLSDSTSFSGTAPTITLSVSPSIATTYTIATLYNSACIALSSDKSGSAAITINPRPTAALSGTQSICNGSSAILSLAVTGSGTISGTLSDGTAFSGTAPTITVSVTPSANTTYTIASLTNGSCTAMPADKTGSATVTINPRPTGAISGNQTICSGSTATLSLAVNGSGTISGTLSNGVAFSGTAPTITVNVSPITTTTFTIASLSNGTCSSIAADRTGSALVTVTTPPSATISYAGNPYCLSSGTASVTRTGTSGGSYSSTIGLTINSGTGDITLGTSTPGTYTITYTIAASGGCAVYAATTSVTISPIVDNNQLDWVNGSHGTLCSTVSENGIANLNAPSGSLFITVGFASYGTPSGSCSSFTIGGCNASTSRTVAEGYLLGNNTGSIPANNTIFGDPCGGTPKNLYVQATYTQPICAGSAPGLIIGSLPTGGTGSYTYFWEKSTTSSSTGFSSAPGTNSAKDYTPGTLTQTSWYRRIVTSGSCSNTSPVIQITVTPTPSATISYTGNPYCSGSGTANVNYTGTPGGSYTSASGLSINASSGAVDLGTSTNGTYTVTYTVAAAGGCSQYQTTTNLTIVAPGSWTGAVNSDWSNSGNWSCGAVPMSSTNVTIPGNLSNYPVINLITASANNISIQTGGNIIVNAGTLRIAGTLSNSGTFNATNGAIEMIGAAGQTIPTNTFLNNAVYDLVINNTSVNGVTLGGALDIYGSLTYTGTGKKFNTNDVLTLKSTAVNTAWVGDMTGNTISGDVTVERYLSSRKAWRFLSVPTNTSQTIRQTWQEGCGSNLNCVANYGTQITGAGGIAAGFDLYSAAPSLKTYNPFSNTLVGVSSTSVNIKSQEGYMMFVRGDRGVVTFNAAPTATTMRTKGNLYTDDQPAIAVSPSLFGSIGNPFAASIDMRKITRSGIKDFFYVWDPNLSGYYGYGAYQTFSYNGLDYVVTPGGGSFGPGGSVCNFIPSGQAFFVQATVAGGTVTFKEAAKTTGSLLVASPTRAPGSQLRTNLYGVNADGSTYVADGTLVNYDDSFTNDVDDMDGIKSANTNENLAIKSTNTLLVIERRHTVDEKDTIQFNLSGVRAQAYRFEFIADKLDEPGLTAYFEDSYLNTRTILDLNGTTTINFTIVNIPGSYASNRFRIVFIQAKVLALNVTNIRAYRKDKDILVDWNAENETNVARYELEYSADGSQFTKVYTALSKNVVASFYSWKDVDASAGFNYYRVKIVDVNGKIGYSKIVNVFIESRENTITVFPNPVKNGVIHLQFENQPQGAYGVRLIDKNGQVIIKSRLNHTAGTGNETINLDKYITHGIYQLELTRPDNTQINIKLIY